MVQGVMQACCSTVERNAPESVDEFVLRCVVIHWNVPLLPASKCYHSNLCVQRIKFQGMKSDKIFNHWNNLSVEDELANALGGIQDKQDVLSDIGVNCVKRCGYQN